MAKRDTNLSCDIIKVVGNISESNTSDWCKAVMKVAWGDNPATLDIRRTKIEDDKYVPTKGISLSDLEADKLVEILLDEGYGSMEALEEALKKKRQFFSLSTEDGPEMFEDDDEPLIKYTLEDD